MGIEFTASMNMGSEVSNVVKSADRVLDVFELLAARRRPMSHTEIGEALGIPKSSLTNLLRNLETRGYLAVIPGPNTFELGPTLFALTREARTELDLASIAKPFVEQVTAQSDESAAFNILRGDGVECVYSTNSTQRLLIIMGVGQIAPLYAVSSGKSILANLPEGEREALLSKLDLEKITPHTKTSVDAVRKELKKVARDGVAYSFEEFTPGITGIGVPVFDAANRPVGALNVAVPASRYTKQFGEQLAATLKDAASRLSREIAAQSRSR